MPEQISDAGGVAMNPAALHASMSLQQRDAGVVGPNAVLQLCVSLREHAGRDGLHAVFNSADLLHYLVQPPLAMVPEEHAQLLFEAVCDMFPNRLAEQVLADAGHATAQYVMANRIPASARALLRVLPAPMAARFLCRAIESHAWTFAGSGQCKAYGSRKVHLEITDNPMATPGCPWHSAVILNLFRSLVDRSMHIVHSDCCARGDTLCRFVLSAD